MQLILGDCIEVMKTLEDNSVDTIITDPPYGPQFMGKEWDKLWRNESEADQKYIKKTQKETDGLTSRRRNLPDLKSTGIQMQEWHYSWALQALRIAKPGAFMFCFGGTRTFHRIACGIEDAGWEVRDCVAWIFGSGFPKSHNIGKKLEGWDGWGTALKPAWEYIGVFMKPRDGTFAENALKHGVAGLNIDGGRVGTEQKVRKGGVQKWEEQKNREFITACIVVLNERLGELESCQYSAEECAKQTTSETPKTSREDISIKDTGCLDGMKAENTKQNSNTEEFGRMPLAKSPKDISSIIKITKDLTIDWKTWNSCQGATMPDITAENITHAVSVLTQKLKEQGNAGRWPSNIIHDGSEEVLAGFPDSKSVPHRHNHTRETQVYGGGKGLGIRDGMSGFNDSGSAARFFYCAKASKAERNQGLEGMEEGQTKGGGGLNNTPDDVCEKYGSIKAKQQNTHPTVKPLSLMEYLCRLTSTPTGGLVLDPFMGSGTTGMACKKTNRDFIGIEIDEHYFEIAERRIASVIQRELL